MTLVARGEAGLLERFLVRLGGRRRAVMICAWVGACLPAACKLPLNRACQTQEDCLSGQCVSDICSDGQNKNDSAPPEPSTDGGEPDGPAGGGEPDGLQGCPAWAEWPMPSPSSLTGVPTDPERNLPNPQSYDTSAADVVVDNVTHLVWQKAASADLLSWADAAALCAALELGGRNDWRLPSRIELISVVDLTAWQINNINDGAFPDCPGEPFWTCSQGPANPLAAYYVDFGDGNTQVTAKTTPYRARCVAGTAAATQPPARYDTTVPGEVRDLKTGLVWATGISVMVNWGQAYDSCNSLAGGWRLPSLMELQTLIDETAVDVAVDPTAFPGTPGNYYLTSSSFEENETEFWFVSIGYGNTWWLGSTDPRHNSRCVR